MNPESQPLSPELLVGIDAYWRASNFLSVGQIYFLDNPLLKERLRREHDNPVTDGAVLPILHLNGYKIASPTIFARIPKDELQKLFEGYGYKPHFVEGHELEQVHQQLAAVMDTVKAEIKKIWHDARSRGIPGRPNSPMIILRTPKGWTCPAEVDGKKCEDYWRSHLVCDVIDRVPGLAANAADVRQSMLDKRTEHTRYIAIHGEDMPEIRHWKWNHPA